MTKPDRDSRLANAVRARKLAPKVAAKQVGSPILAKKLRGKARHEAAFTRRQPASVKPRENEVAAPSARFLRTIALTRAKAAAAWTDPAGVPLPDLIEAKAALAAMPGERLSFDPETKAVTIEPKP